MTYTPVVYDWRSTVQPVNQIFFAGGVAQDGGATVGGVSVESPEPGGLGELRMEFAPFANADSNLDASWLASRMLNGSVFRIRLFSPSVQLLSDTALGGNTAVGVTWSNGLGWSGNVNWAFDPSSPITATRDKGEATFRYNDSEFGRVLKIGHVVGFHLNGYDFCHTVVDISYPTANRTEVTIQPPLRRALTTNDRVTFRPIMTAVCVNARDVVGNLRFGTSLNFNPAHFVEALV